MSRPAWHVLMFHYLMEVFLLIARLPVQHGCCASAGVDYPPWLLSPQSTRDACRSESDDGVSLSPLKETKEPQYHRIYNYKSFFFFVFFPAGDSIYSFLLSSHWIIQIHLYCNQSVSGLLGPWQMVLNCHWDESDETHESDETRSWLSRFFYGIGMRNRRCCGSMVKYFAVAAGSHCGYVTCEGQRVERRAMIRWS